MEFACAKAWQYWRPTSRIALETVTCGPWSVGVMAVTHVESVR